MIYIAGAGKDYCALSREISFGEYMLLDADTNKIGKDIMGKRVYSYDELYNATVDDIVYISSERYYDEIASKIRLINDAVQIENLAKYIWTKKSSIIAEIIDGTKEQYKVKLDVKTWLDSALKDETSYWEWAVKNSVKNNDVRLLTREFEYPYDSIKVSGGDVIVDIGCGPLPKFGNTHNKEILNYHPVDPLAHQYQKILNSNNVHLPVTPKFAIGELLSCFFKKNSADYVIMHNALDHCIDPMRVLIEMAEICKIGGSILLFHADAEGIFENYSGMHKWNITEQKGSMYIFDNKKNMVNVSQYMKDFANLVTYRVPLTYRDGIVCRIEKTAELPEKITNNFDDISGELIDKLFERLVY